MISLLQSQYGFVFLSFPCTVGMMKPCNIGNTLGKYIDRVEPREGLQACARLCVEVDMEKGFLEAIQLTLDNWSYIQKVDYEQLSFKCKACHEYGHFAKNFRKINQIHQKKGPRSNGNNQKGRRLLGRLWLNNLNKSRGGICPSPPSPPNPRSSIRRGSWGESSKEKTSMLH
jgi:hypothetical protein